MCHRRNIYLYLIFFRYFKILFFKDFVCQMSPLVSCTLWELDSEVSHGVPWSVQDYIVDFEANSLLQVDNSPWWILFEQIGIQITSKKKIKSCFVNLWDVLEMSASTDPLRFVQYGLLYHIFKKWVVFFKCREKKIVERLRVTGLRNYHYFCSMFLLRTRSVHSTNAPCLLNPAYLKAIKQS